VIKADASLAKAAGVKMMTVNDDIVISETIPARFLCILASSDIPKQEKHQER
jgi:RNA:NAD 2'-phosphotransferase (TPT1/KptA family)